MLSALMLQAQQPSVELKERVSDFQGQAREVKVTLRDRTTVQGLILRVSEDSFVIREKKPPREVTVPYALVKEVKRKGLSTRTKAILIPAIAGGAVLLVLCAAPYPIGYLCRKDPS
jgi:hypothetical protein